MSKTYDVRGMTCQGCAKSVTNAITKEIPGASVTVDLAAAHVVVEPSDDAKVQKAVEAAGFEFHGAV